MTLRWNGTKVTEAQLLRQVLDYLAVAHVWHLRMNTGAVKFIANGKGRFVRFGAPGFPDVLCLVSGHAIALELKGDGGRQSEKQRAFQQRWEAAGATYRVVRTLEDAIEAIK